MTTIEMFSINVMMKYDDGFHWVGLKLLTHQVTHRVRLHLAMSFSNSSKIITFPDSCSQ